ncbi:MAG: HAD-IA family hydrolase [Bacteroidota bacterium]
MNKSLLIFDFDGTIADTLSIAMNIFGDLKEEFNLPEVSNEQFLELKSKRVKELLKLSGLSWLQLPRFIHKARTHFKKHIHLVKPIQGMPEIIKTLHQQGYKMGILTSNTEEGVEEFLSTNELNYFEFIQSSDSLFGKARYLNNILKKNQLEPGDVIMIGDEIRDVAAAQKVGIDSIAVCWGFNSIELLESQKPNHLLQAPEQLLDLLCTNHKQT